MRAQRESMKKQDSEKKLDVTIATINWNVTDKLQRCIDSVIDSCENLRYEMFVIDNNSQDMDFNEVIHRYSKYRQLIFIKNEKNEGGLALSKIQDRIRGRYLLFLGPDAILKENTVRELIKFMDSRADAGAASGNLLNPDGSPQLYYFKFWNISMVFYVSTTIGRTLDRFLFSRKKRKYYFNQDLNVNRLIEVDQPPGACLIVKPELLLRDGYIIDPDFSFYYNDVDLCKRIWNRGYKIYLVPTAEVIHDRHQSSFQKADPIWKRKEGLKSEIKYFRKHHPEKVQLLKAIRLFDSLSKMGLYLLSEMIRKMRGQKNTRYLFDRKVMAEIRIIWRVFRW